MHDPASTKSVSSQIQNNRLTMLQQEQQMTYKAFELQNFYQNNKLNLISLKDRIEKFKRSKNPNNLSMNYRGQNEHVSKIQDNSYYSTSYNSNNRQSIPSSNTKLERIIVPQSQQEKRELLSQKIESISHQLKRNQQTSNSRNRVTSHVLKDFRNGNNRSDKFVRSGNQDVGEYRTKQFESKKREIDHPRRWNAIKSHFDKYHTVINQDSQSIDNQKKLQIQRQKTEQEDLQNSNDITNKTRYNQIPNINNNKNNNTNQNKLPPRAKQFKIQPITAIAKRQQRYSQKPKPSPKNKSTQKSFIGSQKQSRISFQINSLNKSIHIRSQYQLDKLQALIARLWGLYETLTKIMQHAGDEPLVQEKQVSKYVQEVCGEGYEQVVTVLEAVNCKRLGRAVKLGKMLQNLSVVYLFLQVVKKKSEKSPQSKTNLVNFIGYCTSNVIFLIKVLYLVHDVQLNNGLKSNQSYDMVNDSEDRNENHREYVYQNDGRMSIKAQFPQFQNWNSTPYNNLDTVNIKKLINLNRHPLNSNSMQKPTSTPANKLPEYSYSPHSQSILNTIRKFQLESYKQQLKSILDIIIRMEHNNQTIGIVQLKFCNQNDKYFQGIVNEFLKRSLRDQSQTLFSYARYIFQFLAFHITKFKLYGYMSSLQVAPQPYLSLKFPQTIIIEPYQVLVFQNKLNILIRAYAQKFVQTLSTRCNIVFWTDQMPQEIEPILNLFPKKDNIYTLYRYHCVYDDRLGTFVKPLDRLGGEIDNIIIIDRVRSNFINHKANGIESRWIGEKKDTKLKELLDILQSMLTKQDTLKKSLSQARNQLSQLSAKKKKDVINRKHFKRIDDDFQSDIHQQELLKLAPPQQNQNKVFKDPQIPNTSEFIESQHHDNLIEQQIIQQNQNLVQSTNTGVNLNNNLIENQGEIVE